MKNKKFLIPTLSAGMMFFVEYALAATCPSGVCPAGCTCQCNNAGKITEETKSTYKAVYTYDENNNKTSETQYSGETPTKQYRYTYDENNNKTSETRYTGEANIASNTPSNQYRYTYDANGNRTSETQYVGATDIESNIPSNQTRYTYDANNNMTSETGYDEDSIASNTPVYQYRYTYDANNNQTSQTFYDTPTGVAGSIPSDQIRYTYDENNNRVSDTYYFGEENIASNTPSFQLRSDADAGLIEIDCSSESCETVEPNVPVIKIGDIPVPNIIRPDSAMPIVCVTGYTYGCVAGKVPLADGSSALYKNGILVGYKGKRIYTIDEANFVAGKTNRVSIRYR